MPSTTALPQKKYRSSDGETVRRAKKQSFNPVKLPSSNASHQSGVKGKGRAPVGVAAKPSPLIARMADSDEEEGDESVGEKQDQDEVPEERNAPLEKRKVVGGTSKKGKKFVESQVSTRGHETRAPSTTSDISFAPFFIQSDLLSLVHSITGAQEAKTKSKVQKVDAAKAIVAARTKDKKGQAKAAEDKANSEPTDGRKRVSFA
ncbi:BQ2448_1943 [Microbotryum intermedium]|uniref:BQ2448_1943 protein n=1 Tax=Microbotryum intermedium TaxID=269621 RepID=A0A238FA86_9BASI|nr:BQ2448_1943 [Microbotryum intermedium]